MHTLLPEGWSPPDAMADTIVIEGTTIHRAGICATGPGGEATGSAADVDGDPLERARFELLERISILEAMRTAGERSLVDEHGNACGSIAHDRLFPESPMPDQWRYARSNGIAIHRSWAEACRAARLELYERERVLRAWTGYTTPEPIMLGSRPLVAAGTYEWKAAVFPPDDGDALGAEIEVVGVFGFPTKPEWPVAFGYAARPSRLEALGSAVREATQMLAFLVGEALPTEPPPLAPTATYHLDSAQVPSRRAVLRDWLDHGHAHFPPPRAPQTGPAVFVDLTPAWLPEGWRVAKAVADETLPLVFGHGPFFSHLPPELQVHPIA